MWNDHYTCLLQTSRIGQYRDWRAHATRENEGLIYHDFRDLCNSSDVSKIYCDGLKFTLCLVPEWCSPKLTYSMLDTQTDHEMAKVLQNMQHNPGPGTVMQTKQQIYKSISFGRPISTFSESATQAYIILHLRRHIPGQVPYTIGKGRGCGLAMALL